MELPEECNIKEAEKQRGQQCKNNRDYWADIFHKRYMASFKSENLFPTFFAIQTVTGCNGRCVTCPSAYKNKNTNQYMDDKLFKKIINEIAEGQKLTKEKIVILLMLQNEPFLDKNIIDKIKFTKQFDNLYPIIITNGSLLNKEKIQELEKSGIELLKISVDSLNKKTFEEIRPGLDFDKIMQNIELLKNSNIKNNIKIIMTLQKKNQGERKEFFNYWKNKGIRAEMHQVTNRCGTLKTFDDIKVSDKGITDYSKKFSKGQRVIRVHDGQRFKTAHICFYPFYRLNILSNGDVMTCFMDYRCENIVGNVQETTIKDVWNSKFKEYRQLFLKGRDYDIPMCRKCSIIGNTGSVD